MKKHLLALTFATIAPAAFASPYLGGGYSQLFVTYGDLNDGVNMGTVHITGGYQFNDFLALEARAGMGVGDAHHAGQTFEIDTYYAGFVKIGAPLDNVYPYLLAGYSRGTIETKGASDWTESDMSYGLGISYQLAPSLSMQGEYTNLLSQGETRIIGFNLGMTYHFN